MNPPDADMTYVANKIAMLKGDNDKLQLEAAKELAQLSSDVPATGISGGVLGISAHHVLTLSLSLSIEGERPPLTTIPRRCPSNEYARSRRASKCSRACRVRGTQACALVGENNCKSG